MKPAIKRTGKINQPINIIIPAKIIKSSTNNPIKIKKLLIIAPKSRKIKLDTRTSKNLPMSNPLPRNILYLRQGEKRVLKSKGIEK